MTKTSGIELCQSSSADQSQFKQPLTFCPSFNEFYKQFTPESRSYSILIGDSQLDIEIKYGTDQTIAFFFSGAIDRTKIQKMPAFTFRGITKKCRSTCVFINDPSLYLSKDLRLSWYAGSRNIPLQKILPDVIRHIIEKSRVNHSVFFGGSGGGFASLYYSRFFEESLAIVWNPQTKITQYSASHIQEYAAAAFESTGKDLNKHIVEDLREFYKKTSGKNKIAYIQNISDGHKETHLKPFLKAQNLECPDRLFSGWLNESFYLHMTNWSTGHAVPPRPVLLHLAEQISYPEAWKAERIHQTFVEAERLAAYVE